MPLPVESLMCMMFSNEMGDSMIWPEVEVAKGRRWQ
jgi:hypothetical protein